MRILEAIELEYVSGGDTPAMGPYDDDVDTSDADAAAAKNAQALSDAVTDPAPAFAKWMIQLWLTRKISNGGGDVVPIGNPMGDPNPGQD